MIDQALLKSRLLARLKELDLRLHAIEDELDRPVSADFEERAVEREGDEVSEGLGAAGLAEARLIREALARMRAGEYGVCLECGAEISAERLAAVPHAPLCRRCAGAGPARGHTVAAL